MNGARHDATFEGVSGDQVRLLKLIRLFGQDEVCQGAVYEAVFVDGAQYGELPGATDLEYTETDVPAPFVWLPYALGTGAAGVEGEDGQALIVMAAEINGQWFAMSKLKTVEA